MKAPAERFSGDVWVDAVASPPSPSRMTAGIVRFAPGVRTAWHVHALGQTLHVIDGIALVHSSAGETITAHTGQTIYTAPGEWHWHGATQDRFMSHLALSEADPASTEPTVTWGGHVSDDECADAYRRTNTTSSPTNEKESRG